MTCVGGTVIANPFLDGVRFYERFPDGPVHRVAQGVQLQVCSTMAVPGSDIFTAPVVIVIEHVLVECIHCSSFKELVKEDTCVFQAASVQVVRALITPLVRVTVILVSLDEHCNQHSFSRVIRDDSDSKLNSNCVSRTACISALDRFGLQLRAQRYEIILGIRDPNEACSACRIPVEVPLACDFFQIWHSGTG